MQKTWRFTAGIAAKTRHQFDSTADVRLDDASGDSRYGAGGPRSIDERTRKFSGNLSAGPGHQPGGNAHQPCEGGDCPEVVSVAHRLQAGRGMRSRWVLIGGKGSPGCSGEESVMVRHASNFDGFDTIIRANRTVLLGLLWGALFGCVVAASVYDVGRWVNLW
jgi:hypothetical protein